jgi:glyceraldehyde 3-phosphate dehydrogenase
VAVRVPTPDGSLTDLVAVLSREVTKEEINAAIKEAAETTMKGIIEYCTDPIVSIDIVGNLHSCIFDAGLTSVNGNLVKVMGWYDNEAGYSQRVCDLVAKL